jgi:hypothetical protein
VIYLFILICRKKREIKKEWERNTCMKEEKLNICKNISISGTHKRLGRFKHTPNIHTAFIAPAGRPTILPA